VSKVQHKPIKRSELGFKRKEQKKPKRTLVWRTGQCSVHHRTVSGAPGWIDLKLFTFGFLQAHSAIIHQTVQCDTGLSGAPTGATTISATVDCTVPSQSYSSRQKSKQAPEAHRTVSSACPVWHQTVRCTKMSEL
jgi:hypothetical protein